MQHGINYDDEEIYCLPIMGESIVSILAKYKPDLPTQIQLDGEDVPVHAIPQFVP